MRNIRSSGTKPERTVMSELRKRGVYFAKNVKTIAGKPDIVFRRKKVAVFVDSDFWHGHRGHFVMPKSNIRYWKSKISSNISRDKKVNHELKEQGWRVIRIWESETKKDLGRCIKKILRSINVIGD